jgi:hypothetical protein
MPVVQGLDLCEYGSISLPTVTFDGSTYTVTFASISQAEFGATHVCQLRHQYEAKVLYARAHVAALEAAKQNIVPKIKKEKSRKSSDSDGDDDYCLFFPNILEILKTKYNLSVVIFDIFFLIFYIPLPFLFLTFAFCIHFY